MAWQKTDNLLRKRLNQHGLGVLVEAGLICRHSETLYPGLFEAVSVTNGSLHLKLKPTRQTDFLMVKGRLLHELQTYCKEKNLAPVTRIRLTLDRG